MSDENSDFPTLTSSNNARTVLGWQLSTYQHIQNLAKGLLGILFSLLTVLLSGATLAGPYLPSIALSFSAYEKVARIYPLSPFQSLLLVILNLGIAFLLFGISIFLMGESIELLAGIMLGKRLNNGLGLEESNQITVLSENQLEAIGISDSISPRFSNWISQNHESLTEKQGELRSGAGRILVQVFLLFISLYVYLLLSDQKLFALVMVDAFLILLPPVLAFYWLKSQEKETGTWTVIRPIKSICTEMDHPPKSQIRISTLLVIIFSVLSVLLWSYPAYWAG